MLIPSTTNPVQLAKLFDRFERNVADLFGIFTNVPPKERILQLQRRARIAGKNLILLAPKNRRRPIEVPRRVLTYEDFVYRLRRLQQDCSELLQEGRKMDPLSRARYYGWRLVNRGRKLLQFAKMKPFDREGLVRQIKEMQAREAAKQQQRATVVPIDDPQRQLAEKEKNRSRFVLNVGPTRIVFECTAKIETRTPNDLAPSDALGPKAPVVPMKKPGKLTADERRRMACAGRQSFPAKPEE